jgi:hypothetical protein
MATVERIHALAKLRPPPDRAAIRKDWEQHRDAPEWLIEDLLDPDRDRPP